MGRDAVAGFEHVGEAVEGVGFDDGRAEAEGDATPHEVAVGGEEGHQPAVEGMGEVVDGRGGGGGEGAAVAGGEVAPLGVKGGADVEGGEGEGRGGVGEGEGGLGGGGEGEGERGEGDAEDELAEAVGGGAGG